MESLDGYNKEGSECDLEDDEARYDVDDFQDNPMCGGFFEESTNKLRKGEDSQDVSEVGSQDSNDSVEDELSYEDDSNGSDGEESSDD